MNKEDADDRDDSITTPVDGIEVFCRGRQDLGTTLGGVKKSGAGVTGSTTTNYTPNNAFVGYGDDGFGYEDEQIEAYYNHYNTTNDSLPSLTATDSDGGGVLDGGDGDPLDVMNPYMSMKYIIYTGRSA